MVRQEDASSLRQFQGSGSGELSDINCTLGCHSDLVLSNGLLSCGLCNVHDLRQSVSPPVRLSCRQTFPLSLSMFVILICLV